MAAIWLNGTSSSGKTSIAQAIQKAASVPFLHASLDTFTDLFAWRGIADSELQDECYYAGIDIFHQALPALLSSRYPVIIDHVLADEQWYPRCCAALAGHKVLFVGVHCPLAILREREQARGDRGVGLAEWQYTRVHRYGASNLKYDMEVDTSTASPQECARRILQAFEARA